MPTLHCFLVAIFFVAFDYLLFASPRAERVLRAVEPTVPTNAPKSADHVFMKRLLKDLQNHPQGWPFHTPVNAEDVPDYYDIIKTPMDFSTMEHKLDSKQYSSLDEFVNDTQLVFDNCRMYNHGGSIYVRNANKLEKYMNNLLSERLRRED